MTLTGRTSRKCKKSKGAVMHKSEGRASTEVPSGAWMGLSVQGKVQAGMCGAELGEGRQRGLCAEAYSLIGFNRILWLP